MPGLGKNINYDCPKSATRDSELTLYITLVVTHPCSPHARQASRKLAKDQPKGDFSLTKAGGHEGLYRRESINPGQQPGEGTEDAHGVEGPRLAFLPESLVTLSREQGEALLRFAEEVRPTVLGIIGGWLFEQATAAERE